MSYMALYREFRPTRFDGVVGQEHITDTLKRQVQNHRIAHAYLFSGGRGSGKTSTAKILSRAVNCLNPVNGEPCNECEICKAALEGALTDVTEIDAASNNGVDNIRDIREEVEFLPTNAKYRVYIIDEVHMLSTGAFNALLKTLEEPPAHVIFILATTEPQKLPVTILSRCQRFDFRRISIENICATLKKCADKINVTVDDNAIHLIARMSDGAMRDAYSILDRCIADGESIVTEEKVRELVGIPNFEYLKDFTEFLLGKDCKNILEFMENLMADGKNLEVFLSEEIKFLRDVLIYHTSKDIAGFSEDELKVMQVLKQNVSNQILINLITDLADVQSYMKWSSDTEVAFETGILKIVNKAENLMTEDVNREAVKPISAENITINSLKDKLLNKLKEHHRLRIYALINSAEVAEIEEGLVYITFNNSIDDANRMYLQGDEAKKALKEAIIEVMQKDCKLKYVFEK